MFSNRYDSMSYKEFYESYENHQKIDEFDKCVSCGAYAGEGRQICVSCEVKLSGKF